MRLAGGLDKDGSRGTSLARSLSGRHRHIVAIGVGRFGSAKMIQNPAERKEGRIRISCSVDLVGNGASFGWDWVGGCVVSERWRIETMAIILH